ncbi:hypothetical protein A2954_02155 [Candidatus Roizmanbacteria bacterium RIFCSPLOWO2_01_FULL_37_12]|uniref:Uncharacterized protein n=2 Tax=Microgenomates group TaxID=1794810 RepID=A0A1F7IB15_9BACT|nr:MAG: hypothetical protein A2777_03775 [Candidatus Gottesmanbacteria bacterium RIFCSPHIGHO2_01_FULL_40_15]OGK40554.1 MAG: hypothetical protein A2954_02155 [Candidatus Roizmanbacteria bacterium RIFCSPLOWO2_01_FULL_37_12]
MIINQQTLGSYCRTENVYLTGAASHDIANFETLCYNSATSFAIIFGAGIGLIILAAWLSRLFK